MDRTSGAFDNIQSAINYVDSLGGGKVLIKTGTYSPASSVSIYSDIRLEGEGFNNTVINFGSVDRGMSFVSNTSNISISGITFKNSWGTTSTSGAIYISNGSNIQIVDCFFSNNKDSSNNGYDINGGNASSMISISSCRNTNSATFFYAQATNRSSYISNCQIECFNKAIWGGTGSGGIRISNLEISNCSIYSPASNIYGMFDELNVLNCYLSDEGTSTVTDSTVRLLSNSSNNKFIGNNFNKYDLGRESVLLGTSDNNLFTGNKMSGGAISGTHYDGIRLINSDFNKIIGNSIFRGGTGSFSVNISDSNSGTNFVIGNNVSGTATINDGGTGDVIANNG